MLRPNLFDFGKPFGGKRPASARLPRQSASSLMLAENSRPAESFQVRSCLESKVVTSDNPPSRYFCRRTPRPRATLRRPNLSEPPATWRWSRRWGRAKPAAAERIRLAWSSWIPEAAAAERIGRLLAPALARLTTALLTLYFVLAVGAHIRVRDTALNTLPAVSFLALFGAMTAKGPAKA